MENKHLDDDTIQQYILHKTSCDAETIEHIRYCTQCKIKAGQYKLLFDVIRKEKKPIFDFNLAELVMKQLPEQHQKVSNEKSLFYLIVFIVIVLICVGFYLFGNLLLNLFLGISPILIGLIFTTITSLMVFLFIDMYMKYQRQMKALNSY
ncbi:MAG: hypothetical protein R2757_20195 [Draconibacterium sp.]